MANKDIYHDHVRTALIKDDWTITIAVEVKSFVGRSEVEDLEKALGQFVLYEDILRNIEPERALYLAIRQAVYRNLFEEPIGQILLMNRRLRLVVFNPETKEIVTWLK